MTALYCDTHRAIQAAQGAEKLAGLMEAAIIRTALADEDLPFIASRDFFFLATVDSEGRPTVSYKGGAPGFLRVLDATTLEFPLYDGNGMFLSAGNISATAQIGLLLIDFETPHRLRIQGEARLIDDAHATYPGAKLVIRMALTHVFVNCARYIHRHTRTQNATHVPDAAGHQPVAAWKRIDFVQDSLHPQDQAAASQAGLITREDYEAMLQRGET